MRINSKQMSLLYNTNIYLGVFGIIFFPWSRASSLTLCTMFNISNHDLMSELVNQHELVNYKLTWTSKLIIKIVTQFTLIFNTETKNLIAKLIKSQHTFPLFKYTELRNIFFYSHKPFKLQLFYTP